MLTSASNHAVAIEPVGAGTTARNKVLRVSVGAGFVDVGYRANWSVHDGLVFLPFRVTHYS
jgi:hypothetical protein